MWTWNTNGYTHFDFSMAFCLSNLVRVYITVVAMEVLIKYCINLFKLINSFDRKLIKFLLSSSCSSVGQLDFTSERIDQSHTNNKEVEQFWRKLINFLSNEFVNLKNELIQYFINIFIATTIILHIKLNDASFHFSYWGIKDFVSYTY